MLQSAHDGSRHDRSPAWAQTLRTLVSIRDSVPDPVMRAVSIEGRDGVVKDTMHLTLVQDEEVIEALATDTPEEPLTDGSGSWSMDRSPEHLDAARVGSASTVGPVLPVVVAQEEVRPFSPWWCFPQVVCRPGISRMAGDSTMHTSTGATLDAKDRTHLPTPHIDERQDVAGVRSHGRDSAGPSARSAQGGVAVELGASTSAPFVS